MGKRDARYEYKHVRAMRGREARTLAKWRADGWELFGESQSGLLRRHMSFRRAKSRTRRPRLGIVVGLVAVTVIMGTLLALAQAPALVSTVDGLTRGDAAAAIRDVDGDGLSDGVETSGWRTQDGGVFRTDPNSPDTDGDGLSDGEEAGPFLKNPFGGAAAYAGHSDPTEMDSDGDGLDDATERDGGFDAWAGDSDDDGLDDLEEIEFGSDPLSTNADDDHFDDAEEMTEGGDPNLYDLTGEEAVAAFSVGFGAGGFGWAAVHIGRLNDDQLNSWQYLAGSMARGLVPFSHLSEFVSHLAAREWGKAMADLPKLVPGIGQAAKVIDAAIGFATRGDKATQNAIRFIVAIPVLSAAAKATIVRAVVGLSPDKGRLARDAAVRETLAPAALPAWRPISKSDTRNDRKDEIVSDLQSRGYTDIRVNQQQVNAGGQLVGTNRPDIQATSPGGTRYVYELESPASDRGPSHLARVLCNDDSAVVNLVEQN